MLSSPLGLPPPTHKSSWNWGHVGSNPSLNHFSFLAYTNKSSSWFSVSSSLVLSFSPHSASNVDGPLWPQSNLNRFFFLPLGLSSLSISYMYCVRAIEQTESEVSPLFSLSLFLMPCCDMTHEVEQGLVLSTSFLIFLLTRFFVSVCRRCRCAFVIATRQQLSDHGQQQGQSFSGSLLLFSFSCSPSIPRLC